MKLYGLSGTNGAGKDAIAEILRDEFGFLFISVSDLLRTEAKKRNLTAERNHLSTISAEWRREHGLGALIIKGLEEYEKQGGDRKFKGLVLSSLRNPGEADTLHDLSGKVVWIDADPKIRYERMHARNRDDDRIDYDEFIRQQQMEMHRQKGSDEATLDTAAVLAKSDITVLNEGDSLSELIEIVKKKLI